MADDAQTNFETDLLSDEITRVLRGIGKKGGIPLDDLDDFVQDVLAEALRNREKHDPQRSTLKTWLTTIARNKLVDSIRKKSAAKRRPSEDFVASHTTPTKNGVPLLTAFAAGDLSNSPVRLGDELDHLVDTINLTEKQRAALSQARSESPKTSLRGPLRRAKSKMRLKAVSDESSSPSHPAVIECAYGQLPSVYAVVARLYELSRKTPWFVREIAEWRRTPQWTRLQGQIAEQKSQGVWPILLDGSRWPPRIHSALLENNRKNYWDVRHSMEIAVALPEWPNAPFCSLDLRQVRDRLGWLSWSFGPMPIIEVTDPTLALLVSAGAELPPNQPSASEYTRWIDSSFQTRPGAVKSTHIFRIEWDAAPATAEKSFGRWYRDNLRNHPTQTKKVAGRKRSGRLAALAAVRLIDEFGLSEIDAHRWLECHYGKAAPVTDETFQRALREGRKLRRDFLPEPTEINS